MMHASLLQKLNTLAERYEELGLLLGNAEIIKDQKKFRQYSQEYARLEALTESYNEYNQVLTAIEDANTMLEEEDPELRTLAQDELAQSKARIEILELELKKHLLPKDPNDTKNIFLEIRAGTGGDEAALFAADLYRMYAKYAESQGWQIEIMSESFSEQGGYKEMIIRVVGAGAYSRLKFESGAHRVQRVPVTESQGRIHTSACTVAIMPEADELEEIDINTQDLRIDTFRASGAGGQHVNKTDSAIRITHLPTGIVVECQDERSQHKNRARAMSLLSAKLLTQEQDKQASEQAQMRKSLVGSGDRSERIRTYNYPQGRITDHRINLTLYKLEEVMEGALNQVIEPLINAHQADMLAELSESDA